MDQEYNNKIRAKAKEFLRTATLEELSYILGRYCGPSNQFLSQKKFGYIMPQDLVQHELEERALEDYLLT